MVNARQAYPSSHWAVEGRAPAYDEPDETVYLARYRDAVPLLQKADVIQLGVRLEVPLERTLSCMQPSHERDSPWRRRGARQNPGSI